MKTFKPYLYLLFTAWLAASCQKLVEVDVPPTQVTTDNLFLNDKNAVSAINGVYSQLMLSNGYFLNGGLSVYGASSSDEVTVTSSLPAVDQEFYTNSVSVTNTDVQNNLWRNAYQIIYQTNAIIEGLNKPNGVTAATKKQLLGECFFVRALCYFNMVNLFGDIPLETSTDYLINGSKPRTPSQDVYMQVLNDLKAAKDSLPATYPSTGRVRPNKWAVTALLARVYLYQKDYANAEAQATEVINQTTYSLPTLANAFLSSSSEAILQFQPLTGPGYNTAEGAIFIPFPFFPTIPSYPISNSLFNSFETNDKRKTTWIGSIVISGQTYYYPAKYKVYSDASAITEYNMILRLGEQYLIRAEARAQTGTNLTGAQADLNVIRTRAGLPNTTASTQAQLVTAVAHERQDELFAESAHRWFDLKRTGQADAVLSLVKSNWKSTAALLPIPQSEILTNTTLKQNPGY